MSQEWEWMAAVAITMYLIFGTMFTLAGIYMGVDENQIPEENRMTLSDAVMIIIIWPLIVYLLIGRMWRNNDG